jgi:hypothetical protein
VAFLISVDCERGSSEKMPKRLFKVIAGFLLLALTVGAVWLIYAPAHWLTPFAGAVTVDEHPVEADLYIGHPTNNEAEAIAFVHVSGVGDYFLDFDQEKYREASSKEFIRFKRGVWTLAPMNKGRFVPPLPFREINEFRLPPSNGHTVTVQF